MRTSLARPSFGRKCRTPPLQEAALRGWLDLEVALDSQRAARHDGPIPVEAWAYDANDEPVGTLLVWIKNGRLSALEFGWVTDEMPASLPSPDAVRFIPHRR